MRATRSLGLTLVLLAACGTVQAQVVSQAAPNPQVLTPGGAKDDLQFLMATAAERSSTATVVRSGPNKNLYVQYSGSEYLKWNLDAPAAASYRVFALIKADNGQSFQLQNAGNGASLVFTSTGGWNKIDLGEIPLPAGTSALTLSRIGSVSGTVQVKSLELIRQSDFAAYQARVTAARGDTTWLSQAKYGLFFQYGSWGYPNNVGPRKSVDQQAQDFHVPSFVQMVKNTGASYVVWSFSWWGYKPSMPVPTIDTVIGNGSYTSQRNLIGELAAALKAEGIRFVIYYHTGTEEAGWWNLQQIPSTFAERGTGDRSVFFDNWSAVVADIGNTLGTNLDGIIFDDGIIYYPAKFETLETFARTGNPNRLVSWNNWVMPRLTDFQDVEFGELSHGEVKAGGAPVGGNGVYTSGMHQGLLQHGMFQLESWSDWGIHNQNQKIPSALAASNATLINQVNSASSRGVPLSLNLAMYEDGTIADTVLGQLYALRNSVYGTSVSVPAWTSYNNDWTGISYSAGWTRAANRNAGDYGNDVQWASANGASATISFNGTGIAVYGPMSSADGTAKVTLDGVDVSTLSATFSGVYTPQQHLIRFSHLANGPHTLKITKTGGSYLQLDRVSIAGP